MADDRDDIRQKDANARRLALETAIGEAKMSEAFEIAFDANGREILNRPFTESVPVRIGDAIFLSYGGRAMTPRGSGGEDARYLRYPLYATMQYFGAPAQRAEVIFFTESADEANLLVSTRSRLAPEAFWARDELA